MVNPDSLLASHMCILHTLLNILLLGLCPTTLLSLQLLSVFEQTMELR